MAQLVQNPACSAAPISEEYSWALVFVCVVCGLIICNEQDISEKILRQQIIL